MCVVCHLFRINYSVLRTVDACMCACVCVTVFETIWNCREEMKTKRLTRAFCHYLKLQCEKLNYLIKGREVGQRFPWKCENKDGDCCILTLFETIICNNREKFENKDDNGALCRSMMRYIDL